MSLPDDAVAFPDANVEEKGLASRSAALQKHYAYLGRAVLVRPTKRLGRNGAKKMTTSGIRLHGASEVKQHSDCSSLSVHTLSETKKLTGEPHLPRR